MLSILLSWRYFIRKRVALAAIAAIMVIVMMVIIVLNVMSGLVNEVRGKNQQWSGDIILSRSSLVGFDHYEEFMSELRKSDSVAGVTAVIRSFGITSSNMPVLVYGVDASSFRQICMPGKLDGGGEFVLPENSCFVGTYFGSSFWSKLNITFPGINYRGLPAGPEAGQNQNFEILDTFRIGMPDIDNSIYVNFGQLQQLSWMAGQDNRPARCHELRIRLKDGIDSEEGLTEIERLWQSFVLSKENVGEASLLKDVQVQSWYQFRRSVIAPLENEKNMMSLVFALIAIVCSFIIFAIFYMIVIDKQKDIGIIRSCGGRRYQLACLYLNFGLLVGLIGTTIGLILGVGFVTHTNEIQNCLYERTGFMLWPPDLYAIDKIPDVVLMGETTVICAAAILFSVLGASAPALLAAWRKPVDSLRVE